MTTADRPTSTPRVPFLARPGVRTLAPFVTSALFHVALVGTAVVLFKTVEAVFAPPTREQVIIPDTNLVENADNGGVPNPGLSDDPTRSGTQTADDTVRNSDDWATKKTDSLAKNLLQGSADVQQQNATPIGVGAATGGGQVSGLNTAGLGENAGGNLAPFGPVDGGGAGQGKGLFGIPGGNVKRVVYVCDASGSLTATPTFTLIKRELAEAIGKLRASQAFNVYFFRDFDREPEKLHNKPDLALATAKNKDAAYRMIEALVPKGSTDPRKALEQAFTQKPEMVFLLLDNWAVAGGDFGPPQLAASLDALNKDRRVRIALIVCGDNATEAQLAPWREIARTHGGVELRRVTSQSR